MAEGSKSHNSKGWVEGEKQRGWADAHSSKLELDRANGRSMRSQTPLSEEPLLRETKHYNSCDARRSRFRRVAPELVDASSQEIALPAGRGSVEDAADEANGERDDAVSG